MFLTDKQRTNFWAKVQKSDECWVWTGCRHTRTGHGKFGVDGRTMYAHRVSFLEHGGTIPDGLHLHHRCENPPCVNPAHLEPVEPS